MFHTNNPIIKHKAGLLHLAGALGNVSKHGQSRDTFYSYQAPAEEGGIDALIVLRSGTTVIYSITVSVKVTTGDVVNADKRVSFTAGSTTATITAEKTSF